MYSKSQKLQKQICKALALTAMLSSSSLATAEMVIIVNPVNTIESIKSSDVRKIFLGRAKSFPDGSKVKTFELAAEGETRTTFLKSVLRKDEGTLSAYWARMMFSGKALPPKSFKTDKDVRDAVATNTQAIGFIDSSAVDASVKVIRLK